MQERHVEEAQQAQKELRSLGSRLEEAQAQLTRSQDLIKARPLRAVLVCPS